jgi:hypothetical protein
MNEETSDSRNLYHEELHTLYSSPNTITSTRLVERVARRVDEKSLRNFGRKSESETSWETEIEIR